MVNIDKHILYWRDGSAEDWEAANQLIESGKIRHGLYFVHLMLEKALKAHVCKTTQDIAPRIHNLVKLAELSGLSLEQAQINFLAEINPFNIEGRYPEMWTAFPDLKETDALRSKALELLKWLTNRLSRR